MLTMLETENGKQLENRGPKTQYRRPPGMRLLRSRCAQLGPQGLEDLPMVVMAFITAIATLILFMGISSAHMHQSSDDDMHNYGKRLAELLSGEAFKSEESRSYGEAVLDAWLIEDAHAVDPSLKGIAGAVEYHFSARINIGRGELEFGEDAPNASLSYANHFTVLSGGRLENGKIEVRVWK